MAGLDRAGKYRGAPWSATLVRPVEKIISSWVVCRIGVGDFSLADGVDLIPGSRGESDRLGPLHHDAEAGNHFHHQEASLEGTGMIAFSAKHRLLLRFAGERIDGFDFIEACKITDILRINRSHSIV